jgi:hypothetical protein
MWKSGAFLLAAVAFGTAVFAFVQREAPIPVADQLMQRTQQSHPAQDSEPSNEIADFPQLD